MTSGRALRLCAVALLVASYLAAQVPEYNFYPEFRRWWFALPSEQRHPFDAVIEKCEGGSRDMYLARSKGGQAFSKPEKLGEGTWKLNACPMDGGAIVLTKDGPVTAWRRERTLYLDRPGQPEIPIGEGTDVSIAASKDGIYAIWTAKTGMEVLTPGAREPKIIGERGGFPAIIAMPGGGAIAAWETNDKVAIERIR